MYTSVFVLNFPAFLQGICEECGWINKKRVPLLESLNNVQMMFNNLLQVPILDLVPKFLKEYCPSRIEPSKFRRSQPQATLKIYTTLTLLGIL
jgi:hypothetical protein